MGRLLFTPLLSTLLILISKNFLIADGRMVYYEVETIAPVSTAQNKYSTSGFANNFDYEDIELIGLASAFNSKSYAMLPEDFSSYSGNEQKLSSASKPQKYSSKKYKSFGVYELPASAPPKYSVTILKEKPRSYQRHYEDDEVEEVEEEEEEQEEQPKYYENKYNKYKVYDLPSQSRSVYEEDNDAKYQREKLPQYEEKSYKEYKPPPSYAMSRYEQRPKYSERKYESQGNPAPTYSRPQYYKERQYEEKSSQENDQKSYYRNESPPSYPKPPYKQQAPKYEAKNQPQQYQSQSEPESEPESDDVPPKSAPYYHPYPPYYPPPYAPYPPPPYGGHPPYGASQDTPTTKRSPCSRRVNFVSSNVSGAPTTVLSKQLDSANTEKLTALLAALAKRKQQE